jgi:hypothetical protein
MIYYIAEAAGNVDTNGKNKVKVKLSLSTHTNSI